MVIDTVMLFCMFIPLLFKGKVEDASLVQTVLFSATLPDWVKHVR